MSGAETTEEAVHVVSAAIVKDDTCLVAQRGEGMSFTEKWELPGGKVEPGESAREALRREVREELSVEVVVGRLIAAEVTETEGRCFRVEVFEATLSRGTPRLNEHLRHGWFHRDELDRLDWVEPHAPLVGPVKAHLDLRHGLGAWAYAPSVVASRMTVAGIAAAEWATVPLAWGTLASTTAYLMFVASVRAAWAGSR